MCDILVALPDTTTKGRVIFGKNSDRPAGECQVLSDGHDQGADSEVVHCAHRNLKAQKDVYQTLGCRPYWCWGYETGINEEGVVGGNTAVFTRARRKMPGESYGLLGMELLRFGLEKGSNAEEATGIVVELLERYGQWGPAVQGRGEPAGCYENAFVFVDSREAWLLETAGKKWVARRQRQGTLALSNELTIRDEWSKASQGVKEIAVENGWWTPGRSSFDFALAYSDHENYARQVSHIRWMRAKQLLNEKSPDIDVRSMMSCLRDHYEGTFLRGPQFNPYLPDFLTICMHDSPAGFTWGNTSTSTVVEIDGETPANTPYWVCYQPPCTSVYAAFFMGVPLPDSISRTGSRARIGNPADAEPDEYDEKSLWWRMYRILRGVSVAPRERLPELRHELDSLERDFQGMVGGLRNLAADERMKNITTVHTNQVESIEHILEKLEARWHLTAATVEEINDNP